jgi:hypothetical protein
VSERLRPSDRWGRSVLRQDANVARLVAQSAPHLVELPRLRVALEHAVNCGQWFVVCCLCSVIGELVFATLSPAGKTSLFPKLDELRLPSKKQQGKHKQRGQKRNEAYLPIAALRHTCFHPAMSGPIRDLPRSIFTTMASLHSQDAADWALAELDNALCFELGIDPSG